MRLLSLKLGLLFLSIYTVCGNTLNPQETKTIISCGNPTDIFIPKDITLSPDPPVKGSPLKISIVGDLKEDIVEGAFADVKVKLGIIQLLNQRFDLCQEMNQVDMECPVKAGQITINKEVEIPAFVPFGKYKVHVQAVNADEKDIACFDVAVEFKAGLRFEL